MRLLHISDWHLGRLTYNCSRVPDHDRVIREITEIAKEFRPHLICHTGDVFDAFRPSYPDLARGVDALQTLAALAPVVVICGNHDSPALFRLFATLLGKKSRIRFIDSARPPQNGGLIEFPGEKTEKRRSAGEATQPDVQGVFDPLPVLPGRLRDRTRPGFRPLARSGVMGVGPGKDPLLGQFAEILDIPHPSLPREQAGD